MWPCYRLLAEHMVTWEALQQMDILDVDDLNIVLDAWHAAEKQAAKKR